MDEMSNVTQILNEIVEGNQHNAAQLLPLVYDDLRRLANQKMAREAAGQTLSATGLVHEAFLRLAGSGDMPRWESRVHFFRAAAEAMRRILIDRVRTKQTLKRGIEFNRVELDDTALAENQEINQLLALNESLNSLEVADAKVAELVKLRFFVGLTRDEAAEMLDISPRTADSWWVYAKAFLAAQMSCSSRSSPESY